MRSGLGPFEVNFGPVEVSQRSRQRHERFDGRCGAIAAIIVVQQSDMGYCSAVLVGKITEGCFEVKFSTLWTEREIERERERKSEERRSEREKVRREKVLVREEVGKSPNTVFFQCLVDPEGRKVGSLKRWLQSRLGS